MNNTRIAASIFIGFALVAAAIYAVGMPPGVMNMFGMGDTYTIDSPSRDKDAHMYGNPKADITIVEFSDYECPFCARLHPTLKRIVDESEGAISWEYRHLPLPSHRNAERAALVGECVARELGNDAFWQYTDTVFDNQQSVNTTFLTGVATNLGIREDKLEQCMQTDDVYEQVATDLATARAFGGSGTPFSVVVFADETTRSVSGALPYQNWISLLGL